LNNSSKKYFIYHLQTSQSFQKKKKIANVFTSQENSEIQPFFYFFAFFGGDWVETTGYTAAQEGPKSLEGTSIWTVGIWRLIGYPPSDWWIRTDEVPTERALGTSVSYIYCRQAKGIYYAYTATFGENERVFLVSFSAFLVPKNISFRREHGRGRKAERVDTYHEDILTDPQCFNYVPMLYSVSSFSRKVISERYTTIQVLPSTIHSCCDLWPFLEFLLMGYIYAVS
jgi:hypothetical protein